MDLANSMDSEQQRYVLGASPAMKNYPYMYDLLFQNNLSKKDIRKIKEVAIDLLAKIKSKLSELDH